MTVQQAEILSGIQYKTVVLRDALFSMKDRDLDSDASERIHALLEMAAAYADNLVCDFDLMEKQKRA